MLYTYYFHFKNCIILNNCNLAKIPDKGADGDCHYIAKWMDYSPNEMKEYLESEFSNHQFIMKPLVLINDTTSYEIQVESCSCIKEKNISLISVSNLSKFDIPHSINYYDVEDSTDYNLCVAFQSSTQELRFLGFLKTNLSNHNHVVRFE